MKTTTAKQTSAITKEMVAALNRVINRSNPEEDLDGDTIWVSDFSDENYNDLVKLATVIERLSKKTK